MTATILHGGEVNIPNDSWAFLHRFVSMLMMPFDVTVNKRKFKLTSKCFKASICITGYANFTQRSFDRFQLA